MSPTNKPASADRVERAVPVRVHPLQTLPERRIGTIGDRLVQLIGSANYDSAQ